MSFLFKPGTGVAGTAVDPLGPGGVLIEIPTEVVQVSGAPLPSGHVLQADGSGGFIMGPQSGAGATRFAVQFSHDGGVPSFGTRYLRYGEGNISSIAGFVLSAVGTFRGVTIQVNTTDTNAYDIEVISDPAGRLGAAVVLGTVNLAAAALFAIDRTFAVAVASGVELGVRVVRSAGSGVSTFSAINVQTEWSIP